MRTRVSQSHEVSTLVVGATLVLLGLLLAALGPAAVLAALEAVGSVGTALG